MWSQYSCDFIHFTIEYASQERLYSQHAFCITDPCGPYYKTITTIKKDS